MKRVSSEYRLVALAHVGGDGLASDHHGGRAQDDNDDSFVIPKDAKNVANAHKYINDFLDPEVAAKNGNFVTYAPSSKPARELMEAEFRDDRTIFPSDEDLKNSFIMVPIQPTI